MLDNSHFRSLHQTTIAGQISCSGIGLHSGKTVTMKFYPAEADTGVQFIRLDVEEEKSVVPANYLAVTNTMLGTTISNEHNVSVSTIEHLMAALWGMGVDNVIITLDNAEVPIMDGSSEPFVFLLECVGVKELQAHRSFVEVLQAITISEGGSTATIAPLDGFSLDISIDYPGSVIPRQQALYDFSQQSFKNALCRARTFGFASDVEKLQAMGLARGGSLDNAIVIGDKAVLNEEGLRYNDEFVRHKALDCVGDFYLSGMRLRGAVTTHRPGHGINNKLLRALFADRDAWRLTTSAKPKAAIKRTPFVPAYQVA
ncbi:MAG TPA: UDP-3-O-acyl-N-acetylglucosamine deacetylase [Rickettsiales bacterium]|nr:UDP-3-O-acyl-N-acetylglucosamine deacetylase [Rickettsiales bacterium]